MQFSSHDEDDPGLGQGPERTVDATSPSLPPINVNGGATTYKKKQKKEKEIYLRVISSTTFHKTFHGKLFRRKLFFLRLENPCESNFSLKGIEDYFKFLTAVDNVSINFPIEDAIFLD